MIFKWSFSRFGTQSQKCKPDLKSKALRFVKTFKTKFQCSPAISFHWCITGQVTALFTYLHLDKVSHQKGMSRMWWVLLHLFSCLVEKRPKYIPSADRGFLLRQGDTACQRICACVNECQCAFVRTSSDLALFRAMSWGVWKKKTGHTNTRHSSWQSWRCVEDVLLSASHLQMHIQIAASWLHSWSVMWLDVSPKTAKSSYFHQGTNKALAFVLFQL